MHTISTYSSLIMLLFEGGGSEVNRSISEDGTQRSVTRSRRQGWFIKFVYFKCPRHVFS